MTTTAAEKFMTIAGLEPYANKSFEEVRIDDYLKAYTATGKAPPPCPQHPISDAERASMNLPPLFQPYVPPPPAGASTSSTAPPIVPKPSVTNPAELPPGQNFVALKVENETYQSISCTTDYAFFSPEELRYYAYLSGNKAPPPTVKMDPFVKSVVAPSAPVPGPGASPDQDENLQCITAQPAFADHNFEELRVYYLLAGRREVTSAEIRQYLGQVPAAPAVPAPPQPAAPAPAPGPSLAGSSLFGNPISTAVTVQPKTTTPFSFKF